MQTVELVTQVFEMVEMITISFFESVELAIILWWIPPNPFVGVEMITTQKNEGGISHTWKI